MLSNAQVDWRHVCAYLLPNSLIKADKTNVSFLLQGDRGLRGEKGNKGGGGGPGLPGPIGPLVLDFDLRQIILCLFLFNHIGSGSWKTSLIQDVCKVHASQQESEKEPPL